MICARYTHYLGYMIQLCRAYFAWRLTWTTDIELQKSVHIRDNLVLQKKKNRQKSDTCWGRDRPHQVLAVGMTPHRSNGVVGACMFGQAVCVMLCMLHAPMRSRCSSRRGPVPAAPNTRWVERPPAHRPSNYAIGLLINLHALRWPSDPP